MAKFLMGSQYFFSEYPDFQSKDIDELEIVDTGDFKYLRQLSGMGRCLFQLKRQPSTEEYITFALKSSVGMVVGKFLVPEICQALGFTIKDLPKLQPLINRLDSNHKYEEIIYNSYLENKAFILTSDQRLCAYQSYKESRGT
jgi:hypothetical protein